MLPNFSYIRAKSLEEVHEQMKSPNSYVMAGGTDLLVCLRDHIFPADKLIGLSQVNALHGIEQTPEGGLRIGALTSVTEVSEHQLINDQYRALAQAAGEVASPQLRNQGTIGGNLCQKPRCWYYRGEFLCLRKGGDLCYASHGENEQHAIFGSDDLCWYVHPSDTAVAFTALGAVVHISGPTGIRNVAIEDFFVRPGVALDRETILQPGEIVTEVIVPTVPPGLISSYRKVRGRRSWDFAVAGVALAMKFDGDHVARANIVLSGAAPVPWRCKETEQVVTGNKLDPDTIRKAAEAAMQKAQPLDGNAYKVPLFKAVLEEELTAMAHAGTLPR